MIQKKYEEEISAWNSSLCRVFYDRDSLRGIFSSKEICMKGFKSKSPSSCNVVSSFCEICSPTELLGHKMVIGKTYHNF